MAVLAYIYISIGPRSIYGIPDFCSQEGVYCGVAPSSNPLAIWTFIISVGTFLVTAMGAVSLALLSWRKDRREERESELRSRKLEKEIENLQDE